jgi:hypothetical protein
MGPIANCRVQYGLDHKNSYIALYSNGAVYQPLLKDDPATGCPTKEVAYSHVYSAEGSPMLPAPGQGCIVQCLCNHGTTLRWIGGTRVEITPLTVAEIKEFEAKFWAWLPMAIEHWETCQDLDRAHEAQNNLAQWAWVKSQLLRFSIKSQTSYLMQKFIPSFEGQFCSEWQHAAIRHEQQTYGLWRPGNLRKNNWDGIGYVLRKFKAQLLSSHQQGAAASIAHLLGEFEHLAGRKMNW